MTEHSLKELTLGMLKEAVLDLSRGQLSCEVLQCLCGHAEEWHLVKLLCAEGVHSNYRGPVVLTPQHIAWPHTHAYTRGYCCHRNHEHKSQLVAWKNKNVSRVKTINGLPAQGLQILCWVGYILAEAV